MRSRSAALSCVALLLGLSCSERGDAPARAAGLHLTANEAARVGSDAIARDTVSRIAHAQHLSPKAARDRAVTDALFAVAAREAFAGHGVTPVLERAAWSRALLESFRAEALARGPATDAEVQELSALRWQDFDRPETVRTTHAVARVEEPAADAKAKAVAERIAEAVRGVTDAKEFMRLAEEVPHDGVEVRAERLPALTRDGRSYYPENPPPNAAEQHFDRAFAEAAYALKPGQISPIVKSAFGYHVILCDERLAGIQVPLSERRIIVGDEVQKRRAERIKQELLGRLSATTPILIARAAEDLTARVQVRE